SLVIYSQVRNKYEHIVWFKLISGDIFLKYETFLARIPVLGSHSSAWITLQCSDSIPVLGSLSSAWLVSSARIRIHSVSVSSTRISFSAVFNPESVHIYRL
ncbi:hypothetical protein Anas_13967, partial [Armadillidium nasatum]